MLSQYRYLFPINITHLSLIKLENVEPVGIKNHVCITSRSLYNSSHPELQPASDLVPHLWHNLVLTAPKELSFPMVAEQQLLYRYQEGSIPRVDPVCWHTCALTYNFEL